MYYASPAQALLSTIKTFLDLGLKSVLVPTAMLQVLVPAFSKQQAPARVVLLRTKSFSQTQFYGRKPDQAFPVGLFMVNIDMFQN